MTYLIQKKVFINFFELFALLSRSLTRRAIRTVFVRDRKIKTKIQKMPLKSFNKTVLKSQYIDRSIFGIFVPIGKSRAKTVRVARRARDLPSGTKRSKKPTKMLLCKHL